MKRGSRFLLLLLFLYYPFLDFSQRSATENFSIHQHAQSDTKAKNTDTCFSDYLQNLFSFGNANSGRINRIPVAIRMIKQWESCVSYKLSGLFLSEKYCKDYVHRSVLICINLDIPVIIFPFNTFW